MQCTQPNRLDELETENSDLRTTVENLTDAVWMLAVEMSNVISALKLQVRYGEDDD